MVNSEEALVPRDPENGHHLVACHCGRLRAELLTAIEDQELKEDNCSSCVRVSADAKGFALIQQTAYIGAYQSKDQVRIQGLEHGFEYRSGRKFAGTVHCQRCGVHVFSNVHGPPTSVFDRLLPERKEAAMKVYHANMRLQPLNVRAMEGVDLSSLTIKRTDEGTAGYRLD
jgi:hypothetical protein